MSLLDLVEARFEFEFVELDLLLGLLEGFTFGWLEVDELFPEGFLVVLFDWLV
jgi:hypothetical protein